MANYIHVRDSDNRVVGVFMNSKTPVAGVSEYYENHPSLEPHWGTRIWTRTGVDTYIDSGNDRVLRLDSFHRVLVTDGDTTPGKLSTKIVGVSDKISTSVGNPTGNETLNINIGSDIFDKTIDSLGDISGIAFGSAPQSGEVLTHDGANWVNTTKASAGISEIGHTHTEANITNLRAFGTQCFYVESENESTTTSTSYQTKLTLTTSNLPSGTYRVGWYYELQEDDTSSSVFARVYDESTILAESEIEPQDDDNWYGQGGFCYRSISGIHNFYIKYRTDNSYECAGIRKARLELWRVS
jgi:hypothetical protein